MLFSTYSHITSKQLEIYQQALCGESPQRKIRGRHDDPQPAAKHMGSCDYQLGSHYELIDPISVPLLLLLCCYVRLVNQEHLTT